MYIYLLVENSLFYEEKYINNLKEVFSNHYSFKKYNHLFAEIKNKNLLVLLVKSL